MKNEESLEFIVQEEYGELWFVVILKIVYIYIFIPNWPKNSLCFRYFLNNGQPNQR